MGKEGEPTAGDFTETGYTPYGLTYQDTAKMAQEDGEETEFYAEEEDDPIETIEKAGKTTFTFSVMNPDLTTLKRLFGGEIATDVWAYPDAVAAVDEFASYVSNADGSYGAMRGRHDDILMTDALALYVMQNERLGVDNASGDMHRMLSRSEYI